MPDSLDTNLLEDALDLGLGSPADISSPIVQATVAHGAAYRVLARKYRPQTFSELIGQDAMVQTLGNAIKRDRLAHAFLMTGVRGVGKTSTARLIAKALNCVGIDGQSGPTISPCGVCEPCTAISEGRHIDVIEMDAASHTGVDDVREIIEAVRYAAVSARYKIYIIDEVHMLSKNAFNALLKTLEEPPGHVKFLFATTEVNKVPITVLSRCQRFDLKRVTVEVLTAHFADIVSKEGVNAEQAALTLVAQAAEGSVRDGLSILDQAIAHSDLDVANANDQVTITTAQVRNMLGLSDRGAVRRLFGLLLAGDAQAMLSEARSQYQLGVEPLAMMSGLLAEVHRLTLTKIGAPHEAGLDDSAQNVAEEHSDMLSFPVLHRLWQLLLKGHDEVSRAVMALEASDMALLRIIHGASMPDPSELKQLLKNGFGVAGTAPAVPTNNASAASLVQSPVRTQPDDFSMLLDLLAARNFVNLESTLRDVMRVIEYAPQRLIYQLSGPVAPGFTSELRNALKELSGEAWVLEERADADEAAPTILEVERANADAERRVIMESPLVKAAFAAFPDAELLDSDISPDKRSTAA